MSFTFRARTATHEGFGIFFRDKASIAANSSSTSVTIPATIKTGDALLLVVGWSISSGQTLTSPSGWTMLGTQISDESQVASSLFYRIAQNGDGASAVPIVLSATASTTALLSCYGNTDTTNPIDVSLGAAEGAVAGTTHNAPSVTTTRQRDWLVTAAIDKANPHSTVWTQPSGFTLRTSAFNTGNPGVTGGIGDTNGKVVVGATGTKTWTADGSTSRAVMWSIALLRSNHIITGASGGTSPMLIGAASSNWSSLLTKSGAMNVSRTYDSGFSTTNLPTFSSGGNQISFYWTNNMTVVHSFKPNLALLAAQDPTTMSNLNSLLTSAVGQKVWWCINHEPENDTIGVANTTSTFTLSDYVTAWQVFANAVHAFNEPGWKTIWIMMSFTWKQSFLSANPTFTPDSWYPGDTYVDVVGIDDYNEGSLHNNPGDGTSQRWDSPGFGWGDPDPNESQGPNGGGYYSPTLLNWIATHSKNYAICEFGTIRNNSSAMGRKKTPADPSSGPYTLDWWTSTYGGSNTKADWIADVAKFHGITVPANFGTRCIAMMYFDTAGRTWKGDNTESWQLSHTPGDVDYTAYGAVLTTYGS